MKAILAHAPDVVSDLNEEVMLAADGLSRVTHGGVMLKEGFVLLSMGRTADAFAAYQRARRPVGHWSLWHQLEHFSQAAATRCVVGGRG